MPLIIDCNNFLHAPKPTSLAGLDELELCRKLARTGWRGAGVRIVCDGSPGPLATVQSPTEEIELIYAGPGREADEVIERLIAQDTAPRRLVVVSSDRRIQRAAQRRRAQAWSSERFGRELASALAAARERAPDPGAAPDASLTDEQVQRWLKAFGYDSAEVDHDRERRHEEGEGEDKEDEDDSAYWPPW